MFRKYERNIDYNRLSNSVWRNDNALDIRNKAVAYSSECQDVPMRYKEWLAHYKTKRGYILIAQLIGVAISIIGCSI